MHDQRTHDELPSERQVDFAVYALLTNEDAQRPWTVEEIGREIAELGGNLAATDALARLYGAGLVHRLDGFVFATRPAMQAERLLA
jgi:hypothetical protein